jgi:chemotaxis-related protein WspB
MLFLRFQIGDDCYVLDASTVVEVLPLVRIKQVPGAPRGLAGVINYRGEPVPVVDLCACALERDSHRRLSTRLIIVHCKPAAKRQLALLVEKATESIRLDPTHFVSSGVTNTAARFLGGVATAADGRLLQRVEVGNLLPEHVWASLVEPISDHA